MSIPISKLVKLQDHISNKKNRVCDLILIISHFKQDTDITVMFSCGRMQYSIVCLIYKRQFLLCENLFQETLLTLCLFTSTAFLILAEDDQQGAWEVLADLLKPFWLWSLSEFKMRSRIKRIIPSCFLSSQALYNSIKNEKLEWAV